MQTIEVIGTVFEIMGVDPTLGLVLHTVTEFTFDKLDQCWTAATAFNDLAKANQTGSVMVCWPNAVELVTAVE